MLFTAKKKKKTHKTKQKTHSDLQGSEHESVQHHSHETEHGREENLQIHVTISHVKMPGWNTKSL